MYTRSRVLGAYGKSARVQNAAVREDMCMLLNASKATVHKIIQVHNFDSFTCIITTIINKSITVESRKFKVLRTRGFISNYQ